MSKNLLIVESPSKARTIKKYLGKDYQVLASVGHIKDLPQKEFGVDIEKDFKPKYVTIHGKGRIIQKMRSAAQEARDVYLAPDPDREGEAIAWHIANSLNISQEKVHRVLFNEITRQGIQNGLKRIRSIDRNLVDAQQARRILDRIVGYKVSPFLWRTLYRGLSAGRVQSVALRIICEREDEIAHFVPQEYWELYADLSTPTAARLRAKCIKYKGKRPRITSQEQARKHVQALRQADFQVDSVDVKEQRKSPPPPYTTSTLQQDATRRFKYPPRKTMQIAQQLYEGVEIAGEPVGLITYMRTDSVRIAGEALHKVRNYIDQAYGVEYLPKNARRYKTKKKAVQDAHEGIRPTRFDLPPAKANQHLTPDQRRLYALIWNRFTACQMNPAVYKKKTITVRAGQYLLQAKGSELIFDGYLRAGREDPKRESSAPTLPEGIQPGQTLQLEQLVPEQKFTEPPPRFTEGTLIKELDQQGIGRPSTYATIVSTILTRQYVERKAGSLRPTDLGQIVNRILTKGMPDIFNVDFTNRMEENLDQIESNQKDWLTVLRNFYRFFEKSFTELNAHRQEIKADLQEKTDEVCEKCGAPMVIKWSKNGRFLACSAFPKCKNTRSLKPDQPVVAELKSCPECGSEMVLKEGRYGKFWACSRYPQCKTTRPFTLDIDCPEPDCDGKLVERKTKRGKKFYGCSNYPQCKFATWNEPVDRECPQCGYPLLERKATRNRGKVLYCSKCKTSVPEEE